MASWLLVAAVVIFGLFSFVVLFGAPYLPTLKQQVEDALDLIDLKPGQTLVELGSGDGRVMRAAAQRGLLVVGYELNPLLAAVSYLVTLRYRRQVKIICANFWRRTIPVQTNGIFVFLLQPYMAKLNKKIIHDLQTTATDKKRSIKLVSFAFEVPDRKIIRQRQALFLYRYQATPSKPNS